MPKSRRRTKKRHQPKPHDATSPPFARAKGPANRADDDFWDRQRAAMRLGEAYELIRRDVERLGNRLRRDSPDQREGDIYRYAAGDANALRRLERFAVRSEEGSTAGYSWWMDRAADDGRRETVQITLSLDARGVAVLGCGDRVTPVTPEHWAEMTRGALQPQVRGMVPTSPQHPPTPWTARVIIALQSLLTFDFWFLIFFLALVGSIAAIIVMALL